MELAEWRRKYDGFRRKAAQSMALNFLMELSLQDCEEKFIAGRVKYGGEFNSSAIDIDKELREEAADFQNYSDIYHFEKWKEDPVSFDEYATQYMQ
jgi:hypothetical protein